MLVKLEILATSLCFYRLGPPNGLLVTLDENGEGLPKPEAPPNGLGFEAPKDDPNEEKLLVLPVDAPSP